MDYFPRASVPIRPLPLAIDRVLATANLEAVEVHVVPAERYVENLMKVSQCAVAAHEQIPPDQRAAAP
jgi:hypothetical protein